jgi:hypothetical protein
MKVENLVARVSFKAIYIEDSLDIRGGYLLGDI